MCEDFDLVKNYKANDLKSVLFYIKKNFGLEIFVEQSKLIALFSDLAPSLKTECRMLKQLLQLRILEDLMMSRNKDINTKCLIVKKILTKLIDDEYIQPEIARGYLSIIVEVMEINIPHEVFVPISAKAEISKIDVDNIPEATKINAELPKEILNNGVIVNGSEAKEAKIRKLYFKNTSFLKLLLVRPLLPNFTKKVRNQIHNFVRTLKVPFIVILGFLGIIFGYLSVLFAVNKCMCYSRSIIDLNRR